MGVVSRVDALQKAVAENVPNAETPSAVPASRRPKSAQYRTLSSDDSASVVSWSADAHGRSKEPGWYHQARKSIYAHRAWLSDQEPKGCYISHSKYADEAVRIANTGRLAF